MKQVYLDNAATTAIRPEVIERITKVMRESYGNASSTHSFGRSSKALLEQCRKNIASYFNVSASEIVFTSGGTEADNLALRSAVRDLGYDEIITSKIEHHAVLHTAEQLQKEYNVKITYVDLNDCGLIDYSHLEQLLQKSNKAVVSLMHINNEVGNILDLERVATLCKANNALFHTDTVQSVGHYKIDLQNIPLDFLAASAHKFHGPKGVGFCFIRKESGLKPLIFGGEQERGYRAGTESIHNIVGMDEALKIAYSNLEEDKTYVSDLKDYFIQQLKSVLPEASFNGSCSDKTNSTYTLVNVCLPIAPAKAAMLQFQLDLKGIACSRGSACQSGSNQQSHVLTEILTEDKLKRPSIRFSFSIYNTKEELDYVIKTLNEFVNS
ncbi:cysteine desulfurase family protein [uncultured Winogradskyella sp.]|uniref:cysteine desulfurase family protein n=1 Tax=uncultured Winogradskyella sp. TaxID=395353 RepID=UPI0026162F09|nr:cysteine desulfurase family protein [uncultured Winogradskyella sp.]|tara:strand:+ start:1570 stop:2715 length:1146 start_codon:yes stop_codon:yes gene_type:complete